MSRSSNQNNRVFIGSIPWDVKEEELRSVFERCGPVTRLDIKINRETGRSMGFAFCHYEDESCAESAVRHLNGHVINGREIHVAFPKNSSKGAAAALSAGPKSSSGSGAPVPEPNAYSEIICKMSHFELWDIMKQMQTFIERDPDRARQLLLQSPQLSQALLHAQMLLDMLKVDSDLGARLPDATSSSVAVAPPPQVGGPPSSGGGGLLPPPSISGRPGPGPPGPGMPPMGRPPMGMPHHPPPYGRDGRPDPRMAPPPHDDRRDPRSRPPPPHADRRDPRRAPPPHGRSDPRARHHPMSPPHGPPAGFGLPPPANEQEAQLRSAVLNMTDGEVDKLLRSLPPQQVEKVIQIRRHMQRSRRR